MFYFECFRSWRSEVQGSFKIKVECGCDALFVLSACGLLPTQNKTCKPANNSTVGLRSVDC